jgi:diguanylate cyclase (GGDEF)-like protein/PAS domain S-box-containing protein
LHYQLILFPLIQLTICVGIFYLVWRAEKKTYQGLIYESEARFNLAFDYSPIGIALISLEGHCIKVNKALCKFFGYTEKEFRKIDFQSLICPQDAPKNQAALKMLLSGDSKFYIMELKCLIKKGKTKWALLTMTIVHNKQGENLYYLMQVQDIHKQKIKHQNLLYKASHDNLTGLVNRAEIGQIINKMISSEKQISPFAIFYVDLDNFKMYNDSQGHDFGDKVLEQVGFKLAKILKRKSDIAARYGGDEFLLVLPGVKNNKNASLFAQEILSEFNQPVMIDDQDYIITISIGITFYPENGSDYRALIKSADLALYNAKSIGGNCFVIAS